MHHFGCAVSSYEALEILRIFTAGRTVADVGSGGGYWSFMLSAYGVPVVAIGSGQSSWRVSWLDANETVVLMG